LVTFNGANTPLQNINNPEYTRYFKMTEFKSFKCVDCVYM